jgi:heptosyltransferase III
MARDGDRPATCISACDIGMEKKKIIETFATGRTCSKSGSSANAVKIPGVVWADGTKGQASSKETILIFRIGSLGDTVVALPCFHRIARYFPEACRIVVTNTPVSQKAAPLESVLFNSGLIDGVIRFRPGTRQLPELLGLREHIRQTKARTLVYLANRKLLDVVRDVVFFHWCGIRRIIGAPFAYDLRHVRVDRATGTVEREAERLARCIEPLGSVDVRDRTLWDLRLQPDEVESALRFLTPLRENNFIVMNLGGKVPSKDWGDANWSKLLQLMAPKYSKLALVPVGSADEFSRSERVAVVWPGRRLNLCGLNPRQTAAVMQFATLFVGHDSGPMHLASAVGVRCVAMFGSDYPPRRWHPFGQEHRVIHNMQGVLHISPEEVYAAVSSVIGSSPETPEYLFGGLTHDRSDRC